jgi:hypothetical protein
LSAWIDGASIGSAMIEVDDSELTLDHREFLEEWANNLGVSVEVLLGRIVVAATEGYQYIENAPEYRPE